METTQHTPEPWEIRKHNGVNLYGAKGQNSDWFVFENALEKDAIRIVACVNACAGITNEELADMQRYFGKEGRTYYTLVNDMREAQKQRDELLEALERYVNLHSEVERLLDGEPLVAYQQALLAIKKAKGE